METIHKRIYEIEDPDHPGEFIRVPVGVEIRGTVSKEDPENPGKYIGDKIFRVRRGNGHYDSILNARYQDQYDYFIPSSINNVQSQPYRRQWIAAVHKWRYDLTDAEKKAYNDIAHKSLRMGGYHLFMRKAMKGEIDMYVDRGDPAAYDYAKEALSLDGTWHDLDLSALIPAGTKAVFIMAHMLGAGAEWEIKFRKKGNTNEVVHGGMQTLRANITRHRSSIVAVDANRVIQYKASNENWTTLDLVVKGWWT